MLVVGCAEMVLIQLAACGSHSIACGPPKHLCFSAEECFDFWTVSKQLPLNVTGDFILNYSRKNQSFPFASDSLFGVLQFTLKTEGEVRSNLVYLVLHSGSHVNAVVNKT